MMDLTALPWLLDSDRTLVAAGGLAPADSEPELGTAELLERLRHGANDTFTDLFIVGWSKGAMSAVVGDAVLREKAITWLVRSACVGFIARDAALGAPPTWKVAICDDHAQLPFLLETLPQCSSFAVLEESLCPRNELHLLGRTRFQRSRGSLERVMGDLRHLLHRLPALPASVPLSAWMGAWKGRSALCLAAGPSLDQHIDFIREHQHRCVVIVVDVLQKRLQEKGIKVDFVMTVDSDERLNQRLVPPTDPATVMVMPLMGHRDLDAKFPLRSHFGNGLFARWLLGPDCIFSTGTTVGISSVGFAHYLGCSEAVLLGHDLSYSEVAYYSDFVAGKEQHAQEMTAASNAMQRKVTGNSGGMVITDYLFEVGIQDMGMMLRHLDGFNAYNMNVNTGQAARIAGTKAVPDGWQPAGEGPSPRPASTKTLKDDIAPDLATLVPAKLRDQMRYAVSQWEAFRKEGANAVWIEAHLAHHQWANMGMGYLSIIYQGPLLLHLRLLSLPPSIGTEWHRRQAEDHLLSLVRDGEQFIEAIFDEPDAEEIDPDRHRHPYPTESMGFFNLLSAALGEGGETPADSILLPTACRALRDQRLALPETGFPPPQSAWQGLVVVRGCGDTTPEIYLVQTLCLCALEEFPQPLQFARETKVLPAAKLPTSEVHDLRRKGAVVELDATDAVLRLRAGTSTSTRSDARAACAWPPCHLHVVRALLNRGEAGVDALQQLLDRGDLEPDDQMLSMILLHVADFRRACAMVAPSGKRLGEACQVAMASRRHGLGQHEEALKLALAIRRCSRFRDMALDIACRCLRVLGREAEIQRLVDEFANLDQADFWRAADTTTDWRARLATIEAGTRLPSPEICAGLIAAAWGEQDQGALERLYALLLLRSRPGDDQATRDAFSQLFKSIQPLLRRFGVDTRELGERLKPRVELPIAT